MKTLHLDDKTFIQPFYTPRGDSYRYDYHKQQTIMLLSKVRKHLQKCDSTRLRSERRSPVDIKYLDNQLADEVKDHFVDQSADQEFKLLNGTCLKEMLAYNNIKDDFKYDDDFDLVSNHFPKQRRLKKLQSTILVSKLVKAKGIDKKSAQQIDKEKLNEFIFLQKNQQPKNEQKSKQHKLKLPDIPEITQRRYQRATITTFRDFKPSHSEIEASPIVRQTSLTLISENKIPQVLQVKSKKDIGFLINQINQEKTSIGEQKKDIKSSIAKLQKNYDKIDIFGRLDRQEKFNYLKFEQRIFGKGKHKRYF